jgi:hypothetical protein
VIHDECSAVMWLLSSSGVWFILKNFAVKDTKKLGKKAGFERREAKLFSPLLTFSDLINIFAKDRNENEKKICRFSFFNGYPAFMFKNS